MSLTAHGGRLGRKNVLMKHYKFILAFENSRIEDYVTEKWFVRSARRLHLTPHVVAFGKRRIDECGIEEGPLACAN